MKTGIYWQDPKYALRPGRGFIRDPSLVLDLPLYKLDGASFMSKDARGYLCTVTGALWRPNGRHFDGGDDYIDIGAISGLTDVYTILIWINSDDTPSNMESIFGGTTAKYHPHIGIDTSSKVIVVANASDGYLTANNALTSGQWYLVAVVLNDKYKAIYINGDLDVEETDPAFAANWDTAGHLIGARATTPEVFFDGRIGEVWIYNRALMPMEIERNYLATKWRYQ